MPSTNLRSKGKSARSTLYCCGALALCLFFTQSVTAEMNNNGNNKEYNMASGKMHYMLQCQGCHKAGGEGIEGSIPSMLKHGIAMLGSERGRKFFITVPGSANSPLSDQQLADVLNYISTELLDVETNEHTVRLFDAKEVSKVRNNQLFDVEKERAELVDEITKN